jgi:hypothetical protein
MRCSVWKRARRSVIAQCVSLRAVDRLFLVSSRECSLVHDVEILRCTRPCFD